MNQILGVIVVFGALIFFHELGHFIFAKRAGILCREFALGMGPKLFSFKKGETLYTLRIFPIGGFVRMAGEDPEMVHIKTGQEIGLLFDQQGKVTRLIIESKHKYPQARVGRVADIDLEKRLMIRLDEDGVETDFPVHPMAMLVFDKQEVQIAPSDRQFAGKRLGQRFITIFAGPAANFILALVLLTAAGLMYGVPVNEPMMGTIIAGGPADKAGLLEGDRIVSINGQSVSTFDDIRKFVTTSPGKGLNFEVVREDSRLTTTVVPAEEVDERLGKTVGKMQVYQPRSFELSTQLAYGAETTYTLTAVIFKSLGMLFSGGASLKDLSGPVGIFSYTGDAAKNGLESLLIWAGFLSINLGIFNLLPVPALDGGRLVFLGLEALRGRPIDPHKEGMVHFLGFAFLILLVLVVTWNDIQRILLD